VPHEMRERQVVSDGVVYPAFEDALKPWGLEELGGLLYNDTTGGGFLARGWFQAVRGPFLPRGASGGASEPDGPNQAAKTLTLRASILVGKYARGANAN